MGHAGNWSERKRVMMADRLTAASYRWSASGLIGEGAAAYATCTGCRRIDRLDLRAIARGDLGEQDLRLLEARMRCRACGHLGALVGVVRPKSAGGSLRLVA